MKEIYFIRHAQSKMNLKPNVVGGRSNKTSLTDFGQNQAKILGEKIKRYLINPDKIYSSGAVRTDSTARISLEEAGLRLDLIVSEDLQEMHQGDYVGMDKKVVYGEDTQVLIKKQGKDFKLLGGESMNDVGERMYKWVMENIKQSKEKVFLVYTHGVAIKCLASFIENWSHLKTYQTEIDNTSINKMVLEDGKLKVVYLNKDSF